MFGEHPGEVEPVRKPAFLGNLIDALMGMTKKFQPMFQAELLKIAHRRKTRCRPDHLGQHPFADPFRASNVFRGKFFGEPLPDQFESL